MVLYMVPFIMTIDEAIVALENEKGIRFNYLLKICTEFFEGPRIKGSHHIFKVPWKEKPWMNIQKDGNRAKAYQVKQVKEALGKLKGLQKGVDK